MWQKKAWDIVPDMEAARFRSMKQLAALAASVVKDVLGASPQEVQEENEESRYEAQLDHWRSTMRAMSDEEYHLAVVSGYAKPPERRKTSEVVDLDAWLRQKISERLLRKIDSVVMDLIGIEEYYGGTRLKDGRTSAFGFQLVERAKSIATEMADKWIAENEATFALPKTEEIEKLFRAELHAETKKVIIGRIAIIAKQRAENVRVDVLEAAVDQAMFETFPILRRMEAAERLGAKTEEVAK